ncbi:amidohydrolase [Biscogniauxia mediterranea]|nr:amidohydrolase [Biscogniauxia mediterranea]
MTESSILLQGGTLLLHDKHNHVIPTVSDLLIKGQLIAKIGKDIQVDLKTKVVDCKGKIISPGFIDTHRHLWQTQYKGIHANHTLIGYLPTGNYSGGLWTKEDLFWGQLAGALESIDAGTTTIVDHASCNVTPDHPQAAIQAVLSAGVREIYCYCAARKLVSTNPWKVEDDYFSEEHLTAYRELAKAGPYGNGLVHIGYAMDNIYVPGEVLKPYYADLRDPTKGKAKLITTHAVGGKMLGSGPSGVQILDGHGLLGPDILISHATWPHEHDGALFKKTGACISSTANTELQMGSMPVALRDDHYDNASIGVDCHSWGAGGIPEQMRMTLQAARAERGVKLAEKGLWSRHTGIDVEKVFNLGTIGGAKATGLSEEIGSLREGMKADIVVFDNASPSMLVAAEENPVAAIVLHSSHRDIEMVIIDGVIRKAEGQLLQVTVADAPVASKSVVAPGKRLTWKDVAKEVMESRNSLAEKAKTLDFEKGEEYAINAMHMDTRVMLENV